jgi:hypothetical protein
LVASILTVGEAVRYEALRFGCIPGRRDRKNRQEVAAQDAKIEQIDKELLVVIRR